MSSSDDRISSSKHHNSIDDSNVSSIGSSYVSPERLNVSLEDLDKQDEDEFEHSYDRKTEIFERPPHPLDADTAVDCLRNVGKISTGDSYAFLTLAGENQNLNDISIIVSFVHLKFVDLSSNRLTSETINVLGKLMQVQRLNLAMNDLENACVPTMPSLVWLNLAYNKIKFVQKLIQPYLETLILSYNQIQDVYFTNKHLPKLKFLDLSHNLMRFLAGIHVSHLETLYIGYNLIQSFEKSCLFLLYNLKRLHLRNNYIYQVDEFEDCCKSLEYLNLRGNSIKFFSSLTKFGGHKSLKTIILTGNPIMIDRNIYEVDGPAGEDYGEEQDERVQAYDRFRADVMVFLPNLDRINKHVLTKTEKLNAFLAGSDRFMTILNLEAEANPSKFTDSSEQNMLEENEGSFTRTNVSEVSIIAE